MTALRRWLCCLVLCGCSAADSSASQQAGVGAGAGGAPTGPSAGRAASAAGAPNSPLAAAGTNAAPPPSAAGAGGTTLRPEPGDDAGISDPSSRPAVTPTTSVPGSFKLFDQIPQFGMYATADPKNYAPPAGVTLWKHGTEFVVKLSDAQKNMIGADLSAHITYHAQCDNYDRIGGVFAVRIARAQIPKPTDTRIELVRFITPFSDYQRGALASYAFPAADISGLAHALADPTLDVWIGIGGGSNPYDGDPCSSGNMPEDFKAIGFKYSLEFVSTAVLPSSASITLPGIYALSATKIPVTGTFDNPGERSAGHVTVIVSGHGSDSGGDEYANTMDTLSVNADSVGSFATAIDCAPYAKYSPDGNQGIFSGNNGSNPRNWCPGALVPAHTFAATLNAGSNQISLAISPTRLPSGSYYATSISFSAP